MKILSSRVRVCLHRTAQLISGAHLTAIGPVRLANKPRRHPTSLAGLFHTIRPVRISFAVKGRLSQQCLLRKIISRGCTYNTLSLSSLSKLSSSSPLASYCISAIPSKELETIRSGGIGWLASAPESLAVGPLGGPIGCDVSKRHPGHTKKHDQTLPSARRLYRTYQLVPIRSDYHPQ